MGVHARRWGVHTRAEYVLEVEVLEGEVDLDDSGGFHSGPQNILLGRLVILGPQPLQVIQETEGGSQSHGQGHGQGSQSHGQGHRGAVNVTRRLPKTRTADRTEG